MDDIRHSHDHEEEIEVITVVDDEGREHDFELFTVLEIGDKEYAVLYPIDEGQEDDDEAEAIILRIETDAEGEDTLVDIEDEDEWNKVVAAWEALIASEDGE